MNDGGLGQLRQLEVIDFVQEENRVLLEQLSGRRLPFSDDQRRRLAAKGVPTVSRRACSQR